MGYKYCSYRDACAENVNITSMASRERKRTVGRPSVLKDSAWKRVKRERDKILIHFKVYLGDQFDRWTKKKQELGETHAVLAKLLLDMHLCLFLS